MMHITSFISSPTNWHLKTNRFSEEGIDVTMKGCGNKEIIPGFAYSFCETDLCNAGDTIQRSMMAVLLISFTIVMFHWDKKA
jgi:hypothetical protein